MNITDLENLAKACTTGVVLSDQPYKDYKQAANPQTILSMIELMKAMVKTLEDMREFSPCVVPAVLAKYKEMT